MPGRQSHGGAPSKKPKARVKHKKKALDAFSIASKINPENVKIRKHRLGTSDGDNRPTKRRRNEEDSELEEEDGGRAKSRRGTQKGQIDEADVEEGSDSERNEWKLGQVDDEEDGDIDSEEAFGESDKERFEGFAFGGSAEQSKKKKTKSRGHKDLNLDEDEQMGENNELGVDSEDENLGEEAIDLAAALDASEEDGEEDGKSNKMEGMEGSVSGSDEDSEESEEESLISSTDDDDASEPAKAAALQRLIANLPQREQSSRGQKQRNSGAIESSTPSDFGLKPKAKLTLEDLSLLTIKDPHIKNSLKLLSFEGEGKSSRKVPGKLELPLPKRQQDRLDRGAAYEKTKETLGRWTDTVKHNRRADHLMFPLPDPDMDSVRANNRLKTTGQAKPFNELEATIQNILEESGLATAYGKDDEDHIRAFEDMETNKMSMAEVKARRDQLRMARDLVFREEAKAKRIKKIKSKTYRKIHRKQREKEERLNKEALLEGGFVPCEDELEAQDRRRAEARMGQRHRGSKWAKAMKATGRSAWDEEARTGITELARRDEELRKRVEGRVNREGGEDGSDTSSSDSDDEASENHEVAEQNRLLRKVNKLDDTGMVDDSLPGSKLVNMPFMRKAEEARRKDNAAMIESIRKDIEGEDSSSDAEQETDIGRRKFGQVDSKPQDTRRPKLNDFEEPLPSDDENGGNEIEIQGVDQLRGATQTASKGVNESTKRTKPTLSKSQPDVGSGGGAWSRKPLKADIISQSEAKRNKHRSNAQEVEELDLSKAAVITKPPNALKPKKKTTTATTTTLEVSSSGSEDENTARLPFVIRDQELIKRAFTGADVVGEFEAEKKQIVEDEEEKVIDNTLPGWGSWVGEGISKREKQRNKGRFLTKSEGVKEVNRKDAKLERVIVNEKRIKKNGKYLASSLPHPFETKHQYERSLRLPVGPEWATKETFQDATKPRILLKQGVITPMSKPLL